MNENIEKALKMLKQAKSEGLLSGYRANKDDVVSAATIGNYLRGISKPTEKGAIRLIEWMKSLGIQDPDAPEEKKDVLTASESNYFEERIKMLEAEVERLTRENEFFREEHRMLVNTINTLRPCDQQQG